MRFILLIIGCLFGLAPAVTGKTEIDFTNVRCACVGSKAPSQKDYRVIQDMFPHAGRVQRVLFKEKTYYVLVDRRRIREILSGWETGSSTGQVWLIFNPQGTLKAAVNYPAKNKINLLPSAMNITQAVPPSAVGDYVDAFRILYADLNKDWPRLIRRIELNIHKMDALSQATP